MCTPTIDTIGSRSSAALDLDPLTLLTGATGPVAVVLWVLLAAAVAALAITVLKVRQLGRWTAAERELERAIAGHRTMAAVAECGAQHAEAPGVGVIIALVEPGLAGDPELLEAAAGRALVDVHRRLSTMMNTLASIGSTAPFVGLFGTVYGIMEAFLRISQSTSATLPVVAPAIGEALIATAVGLFAAIPAVLAYNALSQRLDDLEGAIAASARAWVILAGRSGAVETEGDEAESEGGAWR